MRSDLAGTFQQYHPGVTLMSLSGLGLRLFELFQGPIPADQFFLDSPPPPGLMAEVTLALILPLVLAISPDIALSHSVIRHLSGPMMAIVDALYMALVPYDITYSKSVHVDSLLAIFMILSALFLLLYLKSGRLHNLLLSGLFVGLAFLSKSSALNIIAAYGLVWTVQLISRPRRWRISAWQPVALLFAVIIVQAALVLRHHPYYGTHFNLLLGRSQKAVDVLHIQDQEEGMDLAAQYLNELPYGQTKTAAVFHQNYYTCEREFVGRVDYKPIREADYRIYDLNSVIREFHGEIDWYERWPEDQREEPLFTIEFDSLTYMWDYGQLPQDPAPDGPQFDVDYQIGKDITLKNVRLSQGELRPGEPLVIVLTWETSGNAKRNYTVFDHLNAVHVDGFGQTDNIPLLGNRPTHTWQDGEILQDPDYLALDESLPRLSMS